MMKPLLCIRIYTKINSSFLIVVLVWGFWSSGMLRFLAELTYANVCLHIQGLISPRRMMTLISTLLKPQNSHSVRLFTV